MTETETEITQGALTLTVTNAQTHHQVDLDRWGALAAAALVAEGVDSTAEASLGFIEAADIADLKRDHLNGDGDPTDVLAFPIDDDPADDGTGVRMVGDIVICPEYAASNVAGSDRSLEDEIALLVVHGVLHLLGHDHQEADEKAVMDARQDELLAELYLAGDVK